MLSETPGERAMVIPKSCIPYFKGEDHAYLFSLAQIFIEIASRYGGRSFTRTTHADHSMIVSHELSGLGVVKVRGAERSAGELLFIAPRAVRVTQEYTVILKLLPFAIGDNGIISDNALPILTLKVSDTQKPWTETLSNRLFSVQWGGPPLDILLEERQKAPREMFDRFCEYMRRYNAQARPYEY
jgi:hypothetical protein